MSTSIHHPSVLWGFCVFAQIVFKAAPPLPLFALSVCCCPLSNQPISSVPPRVLINEHKTFPRGPINKFGQGFYFGPSKGADAAPLQFYRPFSPPSMPLPSTILCGLTLGGYFANFRRRGMATCSPRIQWALEEPRSFMPRAICRPKTFSRGCVSHKL